MELSEDCKLKLLWSQRIGGSRVYRAQGLEDLKKLYPRQVDWVVANGARPMDDIYDEAHLALTGPQEEAAP